MLMAPPGNRRGLPAMNTTPVSSTADQLTVAPDDLADLRALVTGGRGVWAKPSRLR